MFCSHCGKEIPDEAVFCSYCGETVVIRGTSPESGDAKSKQQTSPSAVPDSNTTSVISSSDHKPVVPPIVSDKSFFEKVQKKAEEKLDIHDDREITHPFQKLGGFLAFVTYASLVACAIGAIIFLVELIGIFALFGSYSRYLSTSEGFKAILLILISLALYGYIVYFSIRFFKMIQKRDTDFLRFYETTILIAFGAMIVADMLTAYSFGNFLGEAISNLISGGIGMAVWLTYMLKSVRVRTYFGTDEYLRKSIFLKDKPGPEPAVPDRPAN